MGFYIQETIGRYEFYPSNSLVYEAENRPFIDYAKDTSFTLISTNSRPDLMNIMRYTVDTKLSIQINHLPVYHLVEYPVVVAASSPEEVLMDLDMGKIGKTGEFKLRKDEFVGYYQGTHEYNCPAIFIDRRIIPTDSIPWSFGYLDDVIPLRNWKGRND